MATAFEEMGVCAELLRVVEEQQWFVPTPVQSEVVPLLLGGGDVLAAAETGSGKTGAFMIPLLQVIQETLLDRQLQDPDDADDTDGKDEDGGREALDKENTPAVSNSARTIGRGRVYDKVMQSAQSACGVPDGVERSLTNRADDAVGVAPLLSWSQTDKDTRLVLSDDCLSCSSQHGKQWVGCRATLGVRSAKGGKFYYECEIMDSNNTPDKETKSSTSSVVRVGWSTIAASLDLGTDRQGFGYGGTGKKSRARQYEDYGETFGPGDVIGCFLDLDAREISFSKNGAMFDRAFGIESLGKNAALFPAIAFKNAAAIVNFGELRPFQYPPPVECRKIGALKKSERVLNSKNQSQERPKVSELGSGNNNQYQQQQQSKQNASPRFAATPLGIILEPSRDLAHQVFECALAFKKYMTFPPVRVALTVGGAATVKEQVQMMHKQSGCDFVIGTPGRIAELIDSGYLDLSKVKFFVLDEVDQLISTDNVPVIRQIHKKLQNTTAMDCGVNRLQVSFFSATLHAKGVAELADQICRHPLIVDLKGRDYVPETVHHLMLEVDPAKLASTGLPNSNDSSPNELTSATIPRTKLPPTDQVHDSSVQKRASALLQNPQPSPTQAANIGSDKIEVSSQVLKYWKPQILVELLEKLAIEQCMVFCRTNLDCDLLEQFLLAVGNNGSKGQRQQHFTGEKQERGKENPFSCCVLAGMRSVASRQRALKAFKDGDVRILICTDVAARGIDVKQLACIVNMTLPDTEENYIHRVGRVGRSDHLGLAISIIATKEVQERVWFHKCSKFKGKGCLNRKSAENGGCTMWYNESGLKRGIEARLQETVACFSTLGDLVSEVKARGGMKQYGAECSSSSDNQEKKKATTELQQHLAPMVKNLIALEERVQNSWLRINELLRQ